MKKLYNLPLVLTLIRLFSPVFIILFFYFNFLYNNFYFKVLALVVFVLFSLTDYFDGFLARNYKITSMLGELLDPIADKVLIITALICLLKFNQLSLVTVILIILREIIVTGIRLVAAENNFSIKVRQSGKYKMVAQSLLICFALLDINKNFIYLAEVITVILSYYSAYFYIQKFLKEFKKWNLK